MKRIAIVGGGLTGLTVAYRLGLAGHDVTLFEGSARLGGQLWTAREDGFIVELGAEGFVARSEAVPRLAADLGPFAPEAAEADRGTPWTMLLDQRATTSFRFDGHELRALAPGEAAEALNFQVARAERGAGIRTFVGGMQTLADRLASAVRERSALHLEAPVRAIELDGLRVRVDGSLYDAVVVATTSAVAARLLAPVLGETELARAETLSSVTVSLAFDAASVAHALDGTGFVVGEPFQGFRACTFTTSKFAHRAPDGTVSLRVFFRPTAVELETETPWAARAVEVLGRVLPIEGEPRRSWVSRWPDALPVWSDAHRAVVSGVERALASSPIHLAGSAFHGSGIDAAVRSAEGVAARLA
jgi:protoporphyrinogen/coproporphyrinogen III oxidase